MSYLGILRKVSLVSAGNIMNAVFGLVFLTASARILSASDFGRYALLTTVLVLMSKVVDLGTNSVFVSEWLKKENSQKLVDRFLTLKLLLFCVSALLSLLILFLLGFNLPILAMVFVLGLIFYSINVTIFAIFQSQEMFTHAVLLNTIPAIIKAVFGGFIIANLFTPSFLIICSIFSLSMGSCAFMYFFIPRDFRKILGKYKPDKGFYSIFTSSLPAGISQLVSQGWSAISNTIIKISKGLTDVGVFYLADKIASIFNLISLSIFTVILPQNARRRKDNLPHDLVETGLLSALVLFLALGFMAVSGVFVEKTFGDKFSGSVVILDILIVASAISAIHAFMENYFYIHDSTKTLMYISLVKLLTYVAAAFTLIPVYSLKGLAVSQLFSSVIGLFLVVVLTFRHNSA